MPLKNAKIVCLHEAVLSTAHRSKARLEPLQSRRCPHCKMLDVGLFLGSGPLRRYLFLKQRVHIVRENGKWSQQPLFAQLNHLFDGEAQMVGWALVQAIHQKPISAGMLADALQAVARSPDDGRDQVSRLLDALHRFACPPKSPMTTIEIHMDPLRVTIKDPPTIHARELRQFLSLIGILHHSSLDEFQEASWDAQTNTLVWVGYGGESL